MTWSLSLLLFFHSSANCYKRVMDETKTMQQKIEQQLGLNPDDKEVVVLYDGETDKVFYVHRQRNKAIRQMPYQFIINVSNTMCLLNSFVWNL